MLRCHSLVDRARCRRRTRFGALAAIGLLAALAAETSARTPVWLQQERLELRSVDGADGRRRSVGTYRVFEDRDAQSGREIHLQVVILHALRADPEPDPVFVLAGGPGQNAATLWRGYERSWMREDRDLVFVSQRGTAGDHRLDCELLGSDQNLQGYLEPIFDVASCRRSLERLSRRADLTLYSTPIAMDDLDEVRAALGYRTINLIGGSYGTRAALVFIRRHGDVVRTATLNGVAPIAFTNPLFHAAGAQEGLEQVFAEIEADPDLRRLYPELRQKFHTVLERLEEEPAQATVRHPRTGEPVEVRVTRNAFAEALRVMLYYLPTNRQVPRLLLRAFDGDFAPFAQRGIESNRGLRDQLAFGMLLCVTAAEDLARIDPETIPLHTAGTFLGDGRVRRQMAVGAIWPKSRLPADYGEPVRSDVPTLILSGTHDPVTPPRWGEEVARHFPHGLHLAVPGAHGVGGPVIGRIQRQFLERASVDGLDLSGLENIRLPQLAPPAPRGPF